MKKNIMIIDDDLSMLDVLDRQLTKAGFEVDKFTWSEPTLLEYMKDFNKYSLVITDYIMPDTIGGIEGGREVVDFIKK